MWKDWTDPDAQISFMLTELEGYSGYFSSALKKYNGKTDYKSVDDVQLACDLWAAVYEGCVCSNAAHSMDVCPAFNGKRYQELAQRRKYAQQIYQAKRGNGLLSIDPNGYSVPNNQSNNKAVLCTERWPAVVRPAFWRWNNRNQWMFLNILVHADFLSAWQLGLSK